MTDGHPALMLGAALACGLMVGIERGWRLRAQEDGSRVAGIRTFTLIGAGGGLAALLGQLLSPLLTVLLTAGPAAIVVIGFKRDSGRRDATSYVAALVVLGLGLLAGAGEPALAVALGALVTLTLAMRTELHAFVGKLETSDVQAFARYAVIAAAVLPFLPNRQVGPLDAWNPFLLWLIIVLITGISFAGYVANRTVGARNGVLATAIIGGAYSSTAVTVALSHRLGRGEQGPFGAGIAIASAVMYLRVTVLVAVLSPSTLVPFASVVGPATLLAVVAATIAWVRSESAAGPTGVPSKNPVALLPAFGFVAIVAAAAVFARWAQINFGEGGIATSLFLTGSFDVDAAIVTLSGLPTEAIDRRLAAVAVGGTIVANMLLKICVTAIYAKRRGLPAIAILAASAAVLAATLVWQARQLALI